MKRYGQVQKQVQQKDLKDQQWDINAVTRNVRNINTGKQQIVEDKM